MAETDYFPFWDGWDGRCELLLVSGSEVIASNFREWKLVNFSVKIAGVHGVSMWVFPKMGTPKMDDLYGKTLLKWMIWGYPYFWKHPCEADRNNNPRFLSGFFIVPALVTKDFSCDPLAKFGAVKFKWVSEIKLRSPWIILAYCWWKNSCTNWSICICTYVMYICVQVVPGRAGGGSFRRKKNYRAKKEFAYRMCARRPTSAMPKPLLCCAQAFCCSTVVMWPVLMSWSCLRGEMQ